MFPWLGYSRWRDAGQLGVPSPESVFDLAYFRTNPAPFRKVAAELWPDFAAGPSPTPAHRLIAHLHASGKLLRCYTQNIDGLERKAGVPGDALVEAHGGFHTSSCIDCKRAHDSERVRADMLRDVATKCDGCGGLVKPDIVFFGENLGQRFTDLHVQDLAAADALIIMGTSLQVRPFSTLPNLVSPTCPRLLINRDAVGPFKCKTPPGPALGTSLDPSHVAAAAAALERVRAQGGGLMVYTGAGMSVTSGVPVFRGADGSMSPEFLRFLSSYNSARRAAGLEEAEDWFNFSVPEMFDSATAKEAWHYWRWRILRAQVQPGPDYVAIVEFLSDCVCACACACVIVYVVCTCMHGACYPR